MTEQKTKPLTEKQLFELRKAYLHDLLGKNWILATRGMFLIYGKQTEDEKEKDATIERNGVGFNGHDAETLTDLVRWWKTNGFFSPNQKKLVMKKMQQYAGQILRLECDVEALDRRMARDGFQMKK